MVSDFSDQRSARAGPPLRFSLRALEVFAATAQAGSTRAAAASVARSQSAASSTLAELERQLGAPLFDRIGRRLVLNERGRALLPQAVALLEQAAELQAAFTGEPQAPLRVAASLTIGEYLLPDLVASWKAERPAAQIRLAVGNTRHVIDEVLALHVEIGFVEGPATHPDLHVRRWLDDELVIVAAPQHPLAAGRVTRRQLAAASWILREPGSGTRQAADEWLAERVGTLKVDMELGSTEAIKRLVAAGAGVACLSRHTVQRSIAHGVLAEVQTRLPPARRRLSVVTRRGRRLAGAAEEFLHHCAAPLAG